MIMTTTVPVSVTDNKQFVPGKLFHLRYIYLISVMIAVNINNSSTYHCKPLKSTMLHL
jgi:hypothetical protein